MLIVTDKRCNVKVGDVFTRLTVIGVPFHIRFDGQRRNACVCQCECGTVLMVQLGALKDSHTTSCGCLRDEKTSKANKTHGKSGGKSRIYGIWCGIRKRCNYSGDKRWMRYGGRGIRICPEWEDFVAFEAWSLANGYASDLTIDRKDSNGHYTPENCRWTTQYVQQRNRADNFPLTAFGESKLITEWAEDERCSISHNGIRKRLKEGWSPEAAVSEPAMKPYGTRSRVL